MINATEAMLKGANLLKHRVADSTIGVIGANGAIGRIGSYLLARKTSKLTLIGKNGNNPIANYKRLKKLANGIYLDCLMECKENTGIRKRLLEVLHTARLTDRFEEEVLFLDKWLDGASVTKSSVPNVIDPIERLFEELNERIPIRYSVYLEEELADMDLILTATSSMSAFVPVQLIKAGASFAMCLSLQMSEGMCKKNGRMF
ncbi:hypothetical protein JCM19047_2689 [Bacillus sp. JCM 19047]|nr:hypothetical protein JCM19047_2689 [Bacillus sp. JCM 19047]